MTHELYRVRHQVSCKVLSKSFHRSSAGQLANGAAAGEKKLQQELLRKHKQNLTKLPDGASRRVHFFAEKHNDNERGKTRNYFSWTLRRFDEKIGILRVERNEGEELQEVSLCSVTKFSCFLQDTELQGDSGGPIPRFVDLDLGSSTGWWAATVATYCPSRPGELPRFLFTKPCG